MENSNQPYEKLIKSDIKISPIILKTNLSPFNNKFNNINITSYNKPYYNFIKKDNIISKNKIISNANNINKVNNKYQFSLSNKIIQTFIKAFHKNKNLEILLKKLALHSEL